MNLMSEGPRAWPRQAVSCFAIAGGLAGLVSILFASPMFEALFVWLIGMIFACIYGMGLWAGIRFLDSNWPHARFVRLYFWLQVPVLQSGVISYFFAGLASASLLIRSDLTIDMVLSDRGGYRLSLLMAQPVVAIGVNIVPLAPLALLWLIERFNKVRPV
jgi:hypothetical protein